MDKVLYRYNVIYETRDNYTGVRLDEYDVVRETDHTYFINIGFKTKRVRKGFYGSWAHDTKEKALEHFEYRLWKRIHSILELSKKL